MLFVNVSELNLIFIFILVLRSTLHMHMVFTVFSHCSFYYSALFIITENILLSPLGSYLARPLARLLLCVDLNICYSITVPYRYYTLKYLTFIAVFQPQIYAH